MHKAILQSSSIHPSRDDAGDALAGITNPRTVADLGIASAWICPENRVHFIATRLTGLPEISAAELQPGQKIVWLPAA